MFLVLIDSHITDFQSIIDSLTDNTEYILFEFRGDTIADIQSKITKNYESVAIIQHNYEYDIYRFVLDCSNAVVNNLETDDPALDTWQQYIDFLLWLKNERGAAFIDLLACNLWANPNWRYMIETTRTTRNLYIRASLDITGVGGNFILESDNFDTIGVYFTPAILNYKYAFYTVLSYYNGFNYNNKYILPASNAARITNTYRSFMGVPSFPSVTNVISVAANDKAIAILKSDGNVVVSGPNLEGGSMPCGIVTQADLVNVTKIIPSLNTFCALKSNGSVVSWGFYNSGYGNFDINTTTAANMVNMNSVRSALVNIVDIYSTGYNTYAALTGTGNVITWGRIGYGVANASTNLLLSNNNITKIYDGTDGFTAITTDKTAIYWGTLNNQSTDKFSSSYPIIDVVMPYWNPYPLYVRKNGTATEFIWNWNVVYTLPTGVTILRYEQSGYQYQSWFFIVLSNQTIVLIKGGVATVYTNATDIATNDTAYAILQNGSVIVGGYTLTGGIFTGDQGLWANANLTNVKRLVSAGTALGAIKSDNTFVWWGRLKDNVNSRTFPTSYSNIYAALSTTNVANIYSSLSAFVITTQDSTQLLGIGPDYTSYSNTKPTGYNIYFETLGTFYTNYASSIPLEIPYAPLVTPTSIEFGSNVVSYYVSNPDLMAFYGRIYKLYYGEIFIDTFIPTRNTHTYVFSNVNLNASGVVTLDIKDETTISYTVTSFTIKSIAPTPCFLEGSKILTFNPDTYQEEYVPVETLRPDNIVLTAESGYKCIHSIGYKTITNPKSDSNPSNRLYKFSKKCCKEILEPLYITGEHCTLHRQISNEKQIEIAKHMGDVYITEEFYRMPACLDERAESYDGPDEPVTIWHFALEHDNVAHNYGVYANGLLVESCAIESLLDKSGMILI